MMMEKKQGQAWSIDMIIAVVIFVLIISILYSVLNRQAETDLVDLQVEANTLAAKLKDPNSPVCNVISGTTLDEAKLRECFTNNPDYIREQLGLKSNFCIYVEDSEGRIIYIDNRAGVGDNDLIIGPTPCGVALQ